MALSPSSGWDAWAALPVAVRVAQSEPLVTFGKGILCRIISIITNGVAPGEAVGNRKPTKFIDVVIELPMALAKCKGFYK